MQPVSKRSEPNPYAPPEIEVECLAGTPDVLSAWRDGSRLVMHTGYTLPPLCAKTLERANSHYILYFGFFHLRSIAIPVSRRWKSRRWLMFFLYICLSLFVIPALTLMMVLVVPIPELQLLFAIAGICGAAFCFLMASDLLSPFTVAGIEGSYIKLQGFSPKYLESLPKWPGVKGLQ